MKPEIDWTHFKGTLVPREIVECIYHAESLAAQQAMVLEPEYDQYIAQAQQRVIVAMGDLVTWTGSVRGDNDSTQRSVDVLREKLPVFIELITRATTDNTVIPDVEGLRLSGALEAPFRCRSDYWRVRPGWDNLGAAIQAAGLVCRGPYARTQLLAIPWNLCGPGSLTPHVLFGTYLDFNVGLAETTIRPRGGILEGVAA